jgi:heme exporter protein C
MTETPGDEGAASGDAAPVGATPAPGSTASRGTRIVGVLALVAWAALLLYGLVLSPNDVVQEESVRLFYLHVPGATVGMVAFGVTALGSAMYLWRRTAFWDLVAGASAEVGVVFLVLGLVAGGLWGEPTWGSYWVWDARGTTSALLVVLFLGYLAVRRIPAAPEVRRKRSAIAGLIAFIDVPLVHFSVEWWNTVHQPATISKLDPTIEGLMLFSFFLGMVAFGLTYWWLMLHRFRVGWLQEQVDQRSLSDALDERRAEAGGSGPGSESVLAGEASS